MLILILWFREPSTTPERDRADERQQERLQRLQMTSPRHCRNRNPHSLEPIPQPNFGPPALPLPSTSNVDPSDPFIAQPPPSLPNRRQIAALNWHAMRCQERIHALPLAHHPYKDLHACHSVGKMDIICQHCNAFHFDDEKLSTSTHANKLFGMCCLQGQI